MVKWVLLGKIKVKSIFFYISYCILLANLGQWNTSAADSALHTHRRLQTENNFNVLLVWRGWWHGWFSRKVNKVKLKKVLKHCAFKNVTAWTTEEMSTTEDTITSLSWTRSQVKPIPSSVSIYVKEIFRFLHITIFKHLMGNFQHILKLFSQEMFCVKMCM